MARAVEQVVEGMHVARMTVELIPLDRFTIAVATLQKERVSIGWNGLAPASQT